MKPSAEDALKQASGDRRSALWLMMMDLPARPGSPDEPYSEEDLRQLRQAVEHAWSELLDAEHLAGTSSSMADPMAVDDCVNEIRKIFNGSRLVSGWSELPRGQQRIAEYVARGLAPKRIASEIFRSSRDIEFRIYQLIKQTGSTNIRQLRLWIAEQRPGRLGLAYLTGTDSDVEDTDPKAPAQ